MQNASTLAEEFVSVVYFPTKTTKFKKKRQKEKAATAVEDHAADDAVDQLQLIVAEANAC